MDSTLNLLSEGEFDTEDMSWDYFDIRAEESKAFRRIYKEVPGILEYHGPTEETTGKRIDRILFPSDELIHAGWCHGPIGVEGKKSGHKMGRVVSQAMDYSRTLFLIEPGHVWIRLEWIFIWPFGSAHGDIGSVMAQNRIGWVSKGHGSDSLRFGTGATYGIRIHKCGTIEARELVAGRKTGSR